MTWEKPDLIFKDTLIGQKREKVSRHLDNFVYSCIHNYNLSNYSGILFSEKEKAIENYLRDNNLENNTYLSTQIANELTDIVYNHLNNFALEILEKNDIER